MAITVDTANASSSSGGSVSSLTFSNTVSSGATLLLVGAGWQDTATFKTITGVTYNGVAMTAVSGTQMNNNDQQSQMWYLVSPASGTHDVVITWSSAPTTSVCGIAVSMSGSNTGTPFGATVTTSSDLGPSSPFNHNITTTGTNSVIVDLLSTDRNMTDLSTSQTNIAQVTYTNARTGMSYKSAATATTYTMTWTSSGPAAQVRSWIVEVLEAPSATSGMFFEFA